MKETYIRDLKLNMNVEEYFMVRSSQIRTGSNGKRYWDVTLGDRTGEISGKRWDLFDDLIERIHETKEKDIIKVYATVTEWSGHLQLRINRTLFKRPADEIDMQDYVKAAPENPEAMYEYILGKAEQFTDADLKAICVKVLTENKERLLYYPAAQKCHHAELGGLLYHTKRMLMTGEKVCEVYTNLKRDLVLAGVILHDMEKMNEIESEADGIATGYSFEGQLLGHIIQGVKSIDKYSLELGIPREKAIMLEHMILSHHYEPEFGSPKKPLFPEAEVLHYLDILDARMFDMEDALAATQPGGFSDKVWTLDNRKLYKPVGSCSEPGLDEPEAWEFTRQPDGPGTDGLLGGLTGSL